MSPLPRCAVIGGAGALGRALISQLSAKLKGGVIVNVDVTPNEEATNNVLIEMPVSIGANLKAASKAASSLGPYDAIYCVAGGWVGGGVVPADDFIDATMAMYERNVLGAVLAAAIAGASLHHGSEDGGSKGLLVFTSAKASLGATPGMLAYGMTKVATNHLVNSLSGGGRGTGLAPDTCVLAILPETLDTPANRKSMPKADPSNWTPLSVVAEKLASWLVDPASRPPTGSLITVVTRNHETSFSAQ